MTRVERKVERQKGKGEQRNALKRNEQKRDEGKIKYVGTV